MQNKGFVKVFAVLLTLVCLFYLSFSFVTQNEEEKVEKWATEQTASWVSECEADGVSVSKEDENAYLELMKEQYLEANSEEKVWLGIYTLQQCRELEIGLGLDLKGGLSVTLEVSVPEFLKSLANNSTDKDFVAAIAAAQKASEVNADVIGAFIAALPQETSLASIFTSSVLKDKVNRSSTNAEVEAVLRAELENAVENSFNVVRSRVDRFGVAQPNIQKLAGGQGRIMVELPGVENKTRVIDLLTRSSNLQFWETYTSNELANELPKLLLLGTEYANSKGDSINPLQGLIGNYGGCVVAYVDRAGKTKIDEVLKGAKLPRGMRLHWGAKPVRTQNEGGNDTYLYELYAIKDTDFNGVAPLQGDVVVEAIASFQNNKPCVNMTMNGAVAHTWANLTESCAKVRRPIAVVLDGLVYSAPVPEGRISGGHSVISGSFTIEETQDLATVLCSGKMLVPMRDVESNVVGPSIGEASINQGLMSFVVAFILLMVYMCAIYGVVPGMIANGALLLNLFFTLGILASFQAALTMSGIAGIVLTLGMAVDANVLIYERAKEELRAGKNVRQSLSDGYKNAFSAIFDSNLTSIITGIILFNFGTGPIKGFATTLIIGLLCSFFTAVFVTRVVYERFLDKNKLTNLTFTTKLSGKLFKETKYNFIAAAKKVNIVFVVLAVAMVASFALRGMAKSIDFTGGRNYVVKFEQKVSDSEVRELLQAEIKDANVQVISYGTSGDQLRISTNYLVDDQATDSDRKVEEVVYNALKKGGLLAADVTFERFCDTQDDKGGSIKSSQKVGASIADDIREGAVLSVILALIAIFIYILVRFRNVAYSVGSIFALAIDVLMIMGCYSLLHGVLPMSLELDQTFIGAILTAIGYSINDKVVIFDRIREYTILYPKHDKLDLFNTSLNTTLARTLNTSFSTLVVLLCIFVLGGDSIRSFSFAMIRGVVFGTLSSIFIAAPVAYAMIAKQVKKIKK